jgi:CheY-like chemotaxis protein
MKMKYFLMAILAVLLVSSQVLAVPTKVMIRVRAKDAKFIGTSMGGILVMIRDADTGELLASGRTEGATGDTKIMMLTAQEREAVLAREQDAQFTAVLDIDEPRRLEVTAYGPLAQRQGANTVSATQWIMPGKDIVGKNGWILEMPGFVVDILAPPTHIKLDGPLVTVPIRANVVMMCGCPIAPEGVWDSNKFEIRGHVVKDGKTIADIPLEYAGTPSQFTGSYAASKPGVYRIVVYAYDKDSGNTGLDTATFIVKKAKAAKK